MDETNVRKFKDAYNFLENKAFTKQPPEISGNYLKYPEISRRFLKYMDEIPSVSVSLEICRPPEMCMFAGLYFTIKISLSELESE